MSEWLADCSTRARLRPGKRGLQEYGGECGWSARTQSAPRFIVSCSIEGLSEISWRSAMKATKHQCGQLKSDPPVLHRFRDVALERSKIAVFLLPFLCSTPDRGVPWDDLRKILPGSEQMAKVPNSVETLRKISIVWDGRTNVSDTQTETTDGRSTTYSVAKNRAKSTTLLCWCWYYSIYPVYSAGASGVLHSSTYAQSW